ncbi:MAG TPA: RNA polymerase sigma factor [Gemmatimonadales bacterium]|nr:RNA polymerase sigma factor [Gemmatimonadales bacterium]
MSTPAIALGRALPAALLTGPRRPGSAMSDLIGRAQAGDEDAFAALYRDHVGRIHALCLRMSGDAHAAADLTQDVFVRAWEALPAFRGDSALGSWLHRLAVNVFLGDRRSSTRRERRVFGTAEPSLLERAQDDGAPALGMDLEQAIAALPERARLVFVLHDVEGYQHGEIAEMAGIAPGTSKAQLFRARRLLRRSLER